MKRDVHKQVSEYTKAHKRKKRWYKIVTCLAAVVVFCTAYALIMPAITLEKNSCDIPEHTHSEACYSQETVTKKELICDVDTGEAHKHTAECYDEAGNLICGKEEGEKHIHTDDCYQLTEEPIGEKKLTCGLQEHTHSEECRKEEQEENNNEQEISEIEEEPVQNQGSDVEEDNQEEKETEKNILSDDSAFLKELKIKDAKVLCDSEASSKQLVTVKNGDTISYGFSVKTESYTEKTYQKSRMKLEVVLPLSSNQAVYDLEGMSWLDDTENYAPAVTEETREISGKQVHCQVLTGYKVLDSGEDDREEIPGECAEAVLVHVLDMEQGETIAIQIHAAMEYNEWDGECTTHQREEKLSVESQAFTVKNELSEEEQMKIYQQFLEEIEKLEQAGNLDDENIKAGEDLLKRLSEAYQQGQLSEEGFTELYDRLDQFLHGDYNSIAEAAEGSNSILLKESGWFQEYSSYAVAEESSADKSDAGITIAKTRKASARSGTPSDEGEKPSGVQVDEKGGSRTSDDNAVSVSKTISGTDLENVFDITLQVQTSMNIEEILTEPDMAVVIVMDISNTMNSNFAGVTRYAAAMESAEGFLDQFAAKSSLGVSKVGYVAFNTDAHQIFGLQQCSTQEQANVLKNTMRTQTGPIINAAGYNDSHSRFTNVEAGLAMASDMLNGVTNKNKFIIFLSDGFPTTYISSGYSGYDPYDSTGRFYDHVLNKNCLYGTSYSDEASIRARKKATAIKNSGVKIFSIGVDVAGQTIQRYITQSENANGFSVVDRTGTTYEIGDVSSTEAYKNWLRNSIGSGYYYDSTDTAGLKSAYDQIFQEIRNQVESGSKADWVAQDPMPTAENVGKTVEFIGFYAQNQNLISPELTGESSVNGENSAVYGDDSATINWDLKKSGYQKVISGSTTVYTYRLVYRVRLKNELNGFVEGTIYPTNDPTQLQYRTIETNNGNEAVSDPKTVDFPIPSVHGYLSELSFTKVRANNQPLEGAQFTLHHDTETCSICRGDGKSSVDIPDLTATSGADGTVLFQNIPSGHEYQLTETVVPEGYMAGHETYHVKVAYDTLTVTVTAADGTEKEWNGQIMNHSYYKLPETGGTGTLAFILSGLALIAGALVYDRYRRRRSA